MSLVSAEYYLFIAVIFALIALFPSRNKPILVLASIFFYGSWHFGFPILLFLLASVNFALLKFLPRRRRGTLYTAVLLNLSFLLLSKFGRLNFWESVSLTTSESKGFDFYQIAIPLGASFFTLQMISTVVDAYYGRIKENLSFKNYLFFIFFFPKLLAGPIEKFDDLIRSGGVKLRSWEDSLRLVLCGVFKKAVLAGMLAPFVDMVFGDPTRFSGMILLIAAVFFRYQLYGDFSGYIDIARGSARLLGFDLQENFKSPYLSFSLQEHWRRWHITLGAWFREYVFFPLAYTAVHPAMTYLYLLIVFALIGVWHGIQAKYLIWGCLNGLIVIAEVFISRRLESRGLSLPIPIWLKRAAQALFTFSCVALSAVFIRANSVADAVYILRNLGFSSDGLLQLLNTQNLLALALLAVALIVLLEIFHLIENRESARNFLARQTGWVRVSVYLIMAGCIVVLGNLDEPRFIYFQF